MTDGNVPTHVKARIRTFTVFGAGNVLPVFVMAYSFIKPVISDVAVDFTGTIITIPGSFE